MKKPITQRLFSATQAIEYLRIARPTFYKYVKDRAILPVITQAPYSKLPVRQYTQKSLDALKVTLDLTAGHSPTGTTSTEKRFEVISDETSVALATQGFAEQHRETLQKFKTSITRALPDNQEAVRAMLLHVGTERGIVERFFTLLESEAPAMQEKMMHMWLSQVLPKQQQTKKVPSDEWTQLVTRMEAIQHTIVNSLQGAPRIQLEGSIIDAEFLDAIEVAETRENM